MKEEKYLEFRKKQTQELQYQEIVVRKIQTIIKVEDVVEVKYKMEKENVKLIF